tara:strand:- start:38 stop:508 length:471 start_codon:yes stop_codon:yes gene_type:complete
MRSSPIAGWKNYIIFENGDVYSKSRRGGGGKLKHTLSNQGYFRVSFYDKKIRKDCCIHRLLGICFIDNPENKPCIDHIDRNRQNNNLSNLRWATYEENANNRAKSLGSIFINKRTHNNKTYEYYRYCWTEDNKRKSKNFKTLQDAEDFKNIVQLKI